MSLTDSTISPKDRSSTLLYGTVARAGVPATAAVLAADAAQHQVGLADVAATLLATCSMA